MQMDTSCLTWSSRNTGLLEGSILESHFSLKRGGDDKNTFSGQILLSEAPRAAAETVSDSQLAACRSTVKKASYVRTNIVARRSSNQLVELSLITMV